MLTCVWSPWGVQYLIVGDLISTNIENLFRVSHCSMSCWAQHGHSVTSSIYTAWACSALFASIWLGSWKMLPGYLKDCAKHSLYSGVWIVRCEHDVYLRVTLCSLCLHCCRVLKLCWLRAMRRFTGVSWLELALLLFSFVLGKIQLLWDSLAESNFL